MSCIHNPCHAPLPLKKEKKGKKKDKYQTCVRVDIHWGTQYFDP